MRSLASRGSNSDGLGDLAALGHNRVLATCTHLLPKHQLLMEGILKAAIMLPLPCKIPLFEFCAPVGSSAILLQEISTNVDRNASPRMWPQNFSPFKLDILSQ